MEFNAKQLEIIGIAEKLFAEKGFSGTSVRDISQEADINASMISYYFGSKEKLIEAVFAVRSQEVLKRFELLRQKDLTPLQKIHQMIDDLIQRIFEKRCFYNIMVREQLSGNSRTPMITSLVQGIKSNHLQSIGSIVTEGQRSGSFRKDIDVLMLYNTLFGTINHTIHTRKLYEAAHQLEDAAEEQQEQYMKANIAAHLKLLCRLLLTNDSGAAS